MYYNKCLYENKIPLPYKYLTNKDIKKSFYYYLHLPVNFNFKILYSRYKCRHEFVLCQNKGWYMRLEQRKYLMNEIVNIGLIITFLLDNNLTQTADKITKELNNIYFNIQYDLFINFLNEYRTAYIIKKKKNKQTGEYKECKDYDIAKQFKIMSFLGHIERNILDVANQPSKSFTINYYPFGYYLLIYEDSKFEEKFQEIFNYFIDENSLINKSDYFKDYEMVIETWGTVYKQNYNKIGITIQKFLQN